MGVRLPGWGREDEKRVATAAAEKAGSKSSNGSGSAHSNSHGGHHQVHDPLAAQRLQVAGRRPVFISRCVYLPTLTSNDDRGADVLDSAGADVAGPPDAGPWPAAFRAAFYAQVVHVPRGVRAHSRLAVPVLSAAASILSECCAAFSFRFEGRFGAVDRPWEQ
jgi:hypothetical protein